ncbi:hypothetical protein ABZ915_08300 [Streptomyces sp. NPDC046915]|uniref:hypothetical protein n=1 Tax=Streptomyces sp. NPDC046915 TaxID=3155257 RepID=UPI0033CDDE96
MSRNFHSIVSASIARIGVTAGVALVITGAPMLSGNAFAAEQDTPAAHSAATVGERISEAVTGLVSELEGSILPLPSRVNGWQ